LWLLSILEVLVISLALKTDAKDARIVYVFKILKKHGIRAVRESAIHKIFYYLSKNGLSVKFDFWKDRKFSYEIRERLEKLVEKGYLKRIYFIEHLGGVYTPVYLITDKGLKFLEKKGRIAKKDAKIIEKMIGEIIKKIKSKKEKGVR